MAPSAPHKPRYRNEPKTVGSAGHSDERVETIDPVGETSAIARIGNASRLVAPQRDQEAHPFMLGGVGVARQRADAGVGAGLVRPPSCPWNGVGWEMVEQPGRRPRGG